MRERCIHPKHEIIFSKEETMISSKKERKKRQSTKLIMETGGTEERDNSKPSYKRRLMQDRSKLFDDFKPNIKLRPFFFFFFFFFFNVKLN
jgi:hypothetical protein